LNHLPTLSSTKPIHPPKPHFAKTNFTFATGRLFLKHKQKTSRFAVVLVLDDVFF